MVWIEGSEVEPTANGICRHLWQVLHPEQEAPPVAEVLATLRRVLDPVLIVFDGYERFRLADDWIRQSLAPALGSASRLLLSGRDEPLPPWLLLPGSPSPFHALRAEPLSDREARTLLEKHGLGQRQVLQAIRFANGHPLALTLAARHLAGQVEALPSTESFTPVIETLVRLYLGSIANAQLRNLLVRCCVTRRITVSMLRAFQPDTDVASLVSDLKDLSFVSLASDGLLVHDVVREAIAAHFRATDPAGFQEARRIAWQVLRKESLTAGRDLWRYTADMLYLVEAPALREVFFPSGSAVVAVEGAQAVDEDAIIALTHAAEGKEGARLMQRWWDACPQAFRITRDASGSVNGYCCLTALDEIPASLLREDPIAAQWLRHLAEEPIDSGERVLLGRARIWKPDSTGATDHPVSAALTLDMKRRYLELRPRLRRLYTHVPADRDLEQYMLDVGFQRVGDSEVHVGSRRFATGMLDFGPDSVDGWLARLVAAAVLPDEKRPVELDTASRELIVDGQACGVTTLEYNVLEYLIQRPGQAVKRGDLLDDIWGTKYEGGSNVVDVVISALRKKLGVRASCIETVPRYGYRFRPPAESAHIGS